ncbi:methyltetrahydrofolate cobalamin methyltransferase [Alkalibaculum bacchi]|jgi:5-methyltetrahydrofolate--homocysteine methyltransferase|nr:methyltetrahydrofolate cobalamin methyltransferase [Alkalibaculum bacchi]
MIIIGEKINGSIPSVAKAIAEKDADFIRNLAKAQTEAGATYIDVCASVEDSIELETMKWLIDLVQEVTDTPIAVDSPNVHTCVEAMKFCNKPGLFNSVSLEGDKIDVAFPAIADTKWEVVALLNDDTGISKTAEQRLNVFDRLMAKAKEYNIDPSRFHIDPIIEMLCTSEDGINMVADVIRTIKEKYPTIHVTGAVSNISFNLPARRLVNQAFTVLAMNAGMDSAILDPLNQDLMGLIFATEALMGEDEYCMEYISAYREGVFGAKKK